MTTPHTEKLLPCPFCKPEYGADEEPIVRKSSTEFEDNYSVECGNNNCRVHTVYFETEEEAFTAWNTRAALPVPAEPTDDDIKYVLDHVQQDIDTQRIFGNGADEDVLRARRGIDKLRKALQPRSVGQVQEVRSDVIHAKLSPCLYADELDGVGPTECLGNSILALAEEYPAGLRIVKSGEEK